jgi:hypothetical protein
MGPDVPLRRNRDYMLVWAGQGVSELGSQVSTVAYPLLVLALTHSPAKAGVVGLAATLPLPLLALPAGMLADHFDRKRLMLVCDSIRALALAALTIAVFGGSVSYGVVAAVAFLDGCSSPSRSSPKGVCCAGWWRRSSCRRPLRRTSRRSTPRASSDRRSAGCCSRSRGRSRSWSTRSPMGSRPRRRC